MIGVHLGFLSTCPPQDLAWHQARLTAAMDLSGFMVDCCQIYGGILADLWWIYGVNKLWSPTSQTGDIF